MPDQDKDKGKDNEQKDQVTVPVAGEEDGTAKEPTARNIQMNPQGDPAREKAFLESAERRTGGEARANRSQLVTQTEDYQRKIKEADILDETEPEGYVSPDAQPGTITLPAPKGEGKGVDGTPEQDGEIKPKEPAPPVKQPTKDDAAPELKPTPPPVSKTETQSF